LGSITRFNRTCVWVSLVWVLGGIPLTLWLRPSYQDFSAFYMPAVAARCGAWDALYPTPGKEYVGRDSVPKPAMVHLGAQHHIIGDEPFVYPPCAAVLLYPLGFFSFPIAHWVWTLFLCASSWGLALFGGKAFALCAERESRVQGMVVLLTACSLLIYRSIRVLNISPFVALCLIASVFSFMGQFKTAKSLAGGLAMTLGAGLKLASAALVPLAVAMRQWRTLAVAMVLTAALLLLSYQMAGRATFVEYFTRIAPTFGLSSDMVSNKSLQGFLLRATGAATLPPAIRYAYRALEAASLAGLLWLIFRQPYASWHSPPRVFAASAALIGWMLIFSPLCWEHYFSYLCPFWGWLIWEASQGPWKRFAALTAIVTQWVPLPILLWLHVPEPINSYMLWGLFVMCGLAVARLIAQPRRLSYTNGSGADLASPANSE